MLRLASYTKHTATWFQCNIAYRAMIPPRRNPQCVALHHLYIDTLTGRDALRLAMTNNVHWYLMRLDVGLHGRIQYAIATRCWIQCIQVWRISFWQSEDIFLKKNVCFVLFYYVVSLFLRFILYIYIYYKFVLHVQRFSTDSGLYSHDVTIVYFFIVFKYCIFSGVWY